MKSKAHGFFVTGTGTDVGKTYVSRLLLKGFSHRGPISYMKPVQTGCKTGRNASLFAPDYDFVKRSGMLVTGDDDLHVPYRFKPACSPHLAARLMRKKISLSHICACIARIRMLPGMKNGCVLVEGAGGVLAPFDDSVSMVHLIILLRLPVILVTLAGLGTLNHTFLTLCALHSANVPLAGVIMNNRENCAEDFIYRDNSKTLRRFIGDVPFLEIKHGAGSGRKIKDFCDGLAKKYL
jgi:dethiobiotin synthetase